MIQLPVWLHTQFLALHIMGQDCCTLGSFYYNNKILVYGKMLLLKRHCLSSKHNSEFFSATVSPLLRDVVQTCLECPQRSELTVMAQMNTGSPAESLWNANLLLNQTVSGHLHIYIKYEQTAL